MSVRFLKNVHAARLCSITDYPPPRLTRPAFCHPSLNTFDLWRVKTPIRRLHHNKQFEMIRENCSKLFVACSEGFFHCSFVCLLMQHCRDNSGLMELKLGLLLLKTNTFWVNGHKTKKQNQTWSFYKIRNLKMRKSSYSRSTWIWCADQFFWKILFCWLTAWFVTCCMEICLFKSSFLIVWLLSVQAACFPCRLTFSCAGWDLLLGMHGIPPNPLWSICPRLC